VSRFGECDDVTETVVKHRPILFSGPMVRAILAGSKTQTRRIVKPQPKWEGALWPDEGSCLRWQDVMDNTDYYAGCQWCPHGGPKDRLWVREKFLGWYNTGDKTFSHVAAFAADGYKLEEGERWKSPIYMPRRASRLTLEIESVRVQRLQEISEDDAVAEGVDEVSMEDVRRQATLSRRDDFAQLWNRINAKRGFGWETNPWVWALTLRRVVTE